MNEFPNLTARASQGDPDALAQLLSSSEPDLLRFAARVCRTTADAEDAVSRAQILGRVVYAVRELRPELREVFLLREVERLSTMACAKRLGMRPGNVKVRLNRARAELRTALDGLR